jgi:hypothetical protein
VFGQDRSHEKSESDAAQVFWDYVRQRSEIGRGRFEIEGGVQELEQRVVQRFGRSLREVLLTDFFGVESREEIAVPVFAFQVIGFRYGSLSLDIDVVGLKGLAEFFDKNIDLFRIVLSQYAPSALTMALGAYEGGWIEGLECAVQPTAEIDRAFDVPAQQEAGISKAIQQPANSSRSLQSLNWAWIVSNTSLVLPVILSLIVMYLAFVSLEHERDRLSQGMSSLVDKQTEIMRVLVTIPQQPKTADTTKPPTTTK